MAAARLRSAFAQCRRPLQKGIHMQRCFSSAAVELDSVDPRDKDTKNMLKSKDFFDVKSLVKLSDLFNARVHLGHHEGCWNGHMKPYIYGSRAHHHIIDLNKTINHLQVALNVLCHVVYRNGIVLFLNTHPRFEYLYQKTAREAGEYCITQKWRGGTLTNAAKLLGRVRLPDLIITSSINSFGENLLPLKEAAMCNIPTIGIVDTDCDPRLITYTIPGNDDTQDAMELYCHLFKTAILRAKELRDKMS
eukprot:gene10893-19722_t